MGNSCEIHKINSYHFFFFFCEWFNWSVTISQPIYLFISRGTFNSNLEKILEKKIQRMKYYDVDINVNILKDNKN